MSGLQYDVTPGSKRRIHSLFVACRATELKLSYWIAVVVMLVVALTVVLEMVLVKATAVTATAA